MKNNNHLNTDIADEIPVCHKPEFDQYNMTYYIEGATL